MVLSRIGAKRITWQIHLLAVDDLKDDFEKILNWAIEFKKLWKSGDELALGVCTASKYDSRFNLRKAKH